jgi:hypothetical protein
MAARAFHAMPAEGVWRKVFYYLHGFIHLMLWLGIIYVIVVFFPLHNAWLWIFTGLFLGFSIYTSVPNRRTRYPILLPAFLTILGVNLLLNTHFYPSLLKYQSGTQAARYIHRHDIPKDHVYIYKEHFFTMDTGLKHTVPVLSSKKELVSQLAEDVPVWVFISERDIEDIRSEFREAVIEKEFDHFHVTRLNIRFLNPESRASALKKRYLVRFDPASVE